MKWEMVRFTDIVQDITGGNQKFQSAEYLTSGKHPIIDQGDSFIGGYSNSNAVVNRTKDVVVFGDHTKGLKFIDFDFCLGADGVKVLQPIEGLYTKFLYYYLGTINLPNVGYSRHYKFLKEIQIPLPPLPIQKRIADILDAADALKRKDQELLKKYDELAQAIFIDMFGDPVKNEKGWEVKTIRSISRKISDGPFGSNLKTEHYSTDGVRVIRLKNIGVNTFNDVDTAFVNIQHYENVLKKYTCIPGDILIGTLGEPNLRSCIFPTYLGKAVNKADCVMLRVNSEICNQDFISYFLNTPSFVESVANKLHGQTRTRISMGQVASLLILMPPKSLQDKFSNLIANLKYQNNLTSAQNKLTVNLFQTLLQKAFKGELC